MLLNERNGWQVAGSQRRIGSKQQEKKTQNNQQNFYCRRRSDPPPEILYIKESKERKRKKRDVIVSLGKKRRILVTQKKKNRISPDKMIILPSFVQFNLEAITLQPPLLLLRDAEYRNPASMESRLTQHPAGSNNFSGAI